MEANNATFWEHLDELKGVILRIIVAVVVMGMVAFTFKEQLFSVILAPQNGEFITYQYLAKVSSLFNEAQNTSLDNFSVRLINTQLTQQFMIHVRMAIYVGFLVVFPYLLFEIFRFVSPALHSHERRYAGGVVVWGYIMFLIGVALSYFLIFPLTFRFLGSYQVSPDVENMISLDSYISTMMMLNFAMGIIFEIPILCWLFAKLGFLTASFMRHYRRHAIVGLLTIAAIITPTSDVVTLLLVALPMYLLYELSILIVSLTRKSQ
ncbi:MAG: twin-arginine translocase subunit TatC [Rikenellaceae bacterium]